MQTNPHMVGLVNPLPTSNPDTSRFTQNDLKQELFGISGGLAPANFHSMDPAANMPKMDQSIGAAKTKSLAFGNGPNGAQAGPPQSGHDPLQLNSNPNGTGNGVYKMRWGQNQ